MKKIILVALSVLVVATCTGCLDDNNGVVMTTSNQKSTEVSEGGKLEGMPYYINGADCALYVSLDFKDEGDYYQLAFYGSGLVMDICIYRVDDIYEYQQRLAETWEKGHKYSGEGSYQSTDNGEITFFTTNNYNGVIIDYVCQLEETGDLSYSSVSRETGNKRVGTYKYVGSVKNGVLTLSDNFAP